MTHIDYSPGYAVVKSEVSELEDCVARINQAHYNLDAFKVALTDFLYDFIKGQGSEPNNFVLQLRDPEDEIVRGMPKVLAAQTAESLGCALDYLVFEFSISNYPNLNVTAPQFPIVNTEEKFNSQASRRLKYLTQSQSDFIERQQPYHERNEVRLTA